MKLATTVFLSLALWACPGTATPLRITAVGDVRISHSSLSRQDRPRLEGDLVLANFEGVLSRHPDPDEWKFSMPYAATAALKRMGIQVLNLANNHSRDLGLRSFEECRQRLQRAGFAVICGEGPGISLTRRGQRLRVVGFSFCDPNNVNNLHSIPQVLTKHKGELLVVTAHLGGENHLSHFLPFTTEYFGNQPRGDAKAFCHRCIDSGADLVLGHGPHVPRALELYHGKLIVYSLGNFLFDYPGADQNAHAAGYSISVELGPEGDFHQADISSYDLRRGFPQLDANQGAYLLIKNLTRHDFPNTNLEFPGQGKVVPKGESRENS